MSDISDAIIELNEAMDTLQIASDRLDVARKAYQLALGATRAAMVQYSNVAGVPVEELLNND